MRERLVIYTALFGNFEPLWEPEERLPGIDWVCFTDQPLQSDIWTICRMSSPLPPRRAARQCKILTQRYLPEYSASLWVDANILPRLDPRELTERFLSEAPLAVHRHPQRDCLYAEADVCRGAGRDDPDVIDQQRQAYQAAGYPARNGLAETGVLLRRHTAEVWRFNERWWNEVDRHSLRDQLSFNYAVWETGLPVTHFPGNLRRSEFFRYRPHQSPAPRRLEIGPGVVPLPGFDTLNCVPNPPPTYRARWGDAPLPIRDATYEFVFASHVLEHIPWRHTVPALREAHRILKPGGTLELWVPDFAYLVDCYHARQCGDNWRRDNPGGDFMRWLNGRLFTYGPAEPNWHHACFDEPYLTRSLDEAGFTDIRRLTERRLGVSHGPIDLGMQGRK